MRACAGGADECACAWAVSGGGALRGLFFFSLSFFPVFFSPVFCLDSERERERERERDFIRSEWRGGDLGRPGG